MLSSDTIRLATQLLCVAQPFKLVDFSLHCVKAVAGVHEPQLVHARVEVTQAFRYAEPSPVAPRHNLVQILQAVLVLLQPIRRNQRCPRPTEPKQHQQAFPPPVVTRQWRLATDAEQVVQLASLVRECRKVKISPFILPSEVDVQVELLVCHRSVCPLSR